MRKLFLFTLLLTGCLGPRPVVRETVVERSNGAYDLMIKIENTGSGEGTVSVLAQLRAGGLTYREEKKAELRPHETSVVHVRINAPEAQYESSVDVEYPPR